MRNALRDLELRLIIRLDTMLTIGVGVVLAGVGFMLQLLPVAG